MSPSRVLFALVGLVCGSGTALATDLGKIERTIAKEPAYRSKPKYCLLVFGPEAKTRVWLALDGDVLYVDRNANGDLTEKGEKVAKVGGKFKVTEITELDGRTKHTDLEVECTKDAASVAIKTRGKHPARAGRDARGKLRFADRPQDAPVIHFNGPLTPFLGPRYPELQPQYLVRGVPAEFKDGDDPWKKPNTLVFSLHTPGLGKGSTALRIGSHHIPDRGTHLVAEIEFPNRRPGGQPIKSRTVIRAFQ